MKKYGGKNMHAGETRISTNISMKSLHSIANNFAIGHAVKGPPPPRPPPKPGKYLYEITALNN
jgi:hypothetical protein